MASRGEEQSLAAADGSEALPLPAPEKLEQFNGQWVAVFRGEVVGFGKSPAAALNRAHARGVDQPIVFRAPLRPKGRAYY